MCFTSTDNSHPSSNHVIETPPPSRYRTVTFNDSVMLRTERKSLGTSVLQRKQNTTFTQQQELKTEETQISTDTDDSKSKTYKLKKSFKPTYINLEGSQLHPDKAFQGLNSGKQRFRQPHSPFPTKEQLAALKPVAGTPGMSCHQ